MRNVILALFLMAQFSFAEEVTISEIESLLLDAEQGNVQAQADIGLKYFEANGVPKNPERAISWTKKAADAGNGQAQVNLGYFYLIGFGVDKDVGEAIYWNEAAAMQGEAQASYNLGGLYYGGNGVEKNFEKAFDYFKNSAEGNHVAALLTAAGMYALGVGVEVNGAEAVKYYTKAADMGDVQSHVDLGKIYAKGDIVPRSYNSARFWLSKAVALGSNEAKTILQKLLELEALAADQEKTESMAHLNKLRSEYSGRLNYVTPFARSVIQNFSLDCRAADGRYLPLENILLAKLASMDTKSSWLVIRADSKGDHIRIYDDLVGSDGRVMHSIVAFEINGWGELRSMNGRMEAVLNSCFGGHGQIWLIP